MKEYQIETIMKWTKIIQSLFAAGMNNTNTSPVIQTLRLDRYLSR